MVALKCTVLRWLSSLGMELKFQTVNKHLQNESYNCHIQYRYCMILYYIVQHIEERRYFKQRPGNDSHVVFHLLTCASEMKGSSNSSQCRNAILIMTLLS